MGRTQAGSTKPVTAAATAAAAATVVSMVHNCQLVKMAVMGFLMIMVMMLLKMMMMTKQAICWNCVLLFQSDSADSGGLDSAVAVHA